MSQAPPLLSIRRLSKAFGGLKAVSQVDIELRAGEILSLIGPNGSGKTTLFNLISGIYQPDEGEVWLQDHRAVNLVGLRPHKITAQGVARTFQNIRIFPDMTVLENVMVGFHCRTQSGPLSALFKTPAQKKEEQYIVTEAQRRLALFRQLLPLINEPAKTLPYAYRKRLEIVRALASSPRLLLLDEPAAGMNPHETKELMADLHRLRESGYTLMVIEHDMLMVKGLSDRVIAFDYGQKIAEGTFDEVRRNERVIEAYLGKAARC
ncbi:MAG: ABC transporter ATP-binding protein [Candidatus Schekmanbacteria bacterium]|nr:ABC transporter ATP-binding protein [Candidatus Schekmanbacteria bacterium]